MIRVLVVDDSAFMRKAIKTMLDKDPEIEVIDVAKNGEEGLEKIRELDPDVVTLDIEMPRMDGLTALRHIMMELPRPVLMISSLTTEGGESTLKAMELGAVDYIPKQLSKVSLDIVRIEEDLRSKVKIIARQKFTPPKGVKRKKPAPIKKIKPQGKQVRDLIAIGVSTGGPPAVQRVLSVLDSDFPASIVIAQHMPAAFTGPFAKRLNECCKIEVLEAKSGDRLKNGVAFIAPGGKHLVLHQQTTHVELEITDKPKEAIYRPSADVLISSAAQAIGKRCLGVILTGMGKDGLEGVRLLRSKGGITLAQSESSCVVYGMPKSVVDAGLADEVVHIDDMAEALQYRLFN